MAFVKKTWKDRLVQYANRRLLTKGGGVTEQVTVTRDEGTVYEAGDKFDAATMNDLENRIYNAIDIISPVQYQKIGLILNSDGGTISGCGIAIITLSNGIARIDFSLMIETADENSHSYWGINRDYFRTLTGKIISVKEGGVLTYYKPDGTINADRQGYGGAFVVANQFWKPARVYKSGSNYALGSWSDTLFPVGTRMVGTCYGSYT